MMKNLLPKLVAAALLSASGLASAAGCATTDLTFDLPGVTVSKCYSTAGNVVDSSPADKLTVSNLLASQFSFFGQSGAPITSFNVSADPLTHVTTYDFPQLLTGNVIVGLHFGNGQGGPGNVTNFYAFNAGSGVDKFFTALQATSNAGLYQIGAPVPEPETYAMMLAGLGLVGFIARRRKTRA
ncbi:MULTISPECIES: PEP-CTERM sorting domain-containing protein [unclassified Duganella]|uniref:PEP-CTERM sorting domain-containing protein n=1 Tax=unclassified Duganella TaxID=2636909 RepID=UPI001E423EC8|nr:MULTISPECIES: PEP-CTERM sorting domain-containing protein [unclassified Duganella]